MFKIVKGGHSGNDTSLIIPDSWPRKIKHSSKCYDEATDMFIQPSYEDFCCTVARKQIALISSNVFLTLGLRFVLEDVRDSILHVYKSFEDLHKSAVKKFDVIIFAAMDMVGVSELYRLIIRSKLDSHKLSIIIISDTNVRSTLENIIKHYNTLKVIGLHENLSMIRDELLMSLKNISTGKEMDSFPLTLTPRQADILAMTATGLSIEDIAIRKSISTSTVYTLKRRALEKAGATNKVLESVLYSQIRNRTDFHQI